MSRAWQKANAERFKAYRRERYAKMREARKRWEELCRQEEEWEKAKLSTLHEEIH